MWKKIFGAHTFNHSVFTVTKVFNKIFTIFWGYPAFYFYKEKLPSKDLATISSKVACGYQKMF